MPRGIGAIRAGVKERLVFSAVKRSNTDNIFFCPSRLGCLHAIEEMIPVGKKEGPAMASIPTCAVKLANDRRRATRGRDTRQWNIGRSCKENNSVAIPGSTARSGCVANCLRRPTGGFDLSQLPSGKKTYEAAVMRPKGIRGTFGAIKHLTRKRVKGSNPKA